MPLILAGAASQNYITDTLVHAAPTTGPYAYSPPYANWIPGQAGFLAVGEAYTEPVFGTTVRRLSNNLALTDNSTSADIYGGNGRWNSDSTYFWNTFRDGSVKAIHTITGATKSLTNAGGSHRGDSTCSPVESDAFFYESGNQLIKQLISDGTTSVYKDFGVALGGLGGSMNRLTGDGRYWVVNLSTTGTPSYRIWDSQTNTLFSGAVTDTAAISGGWAMIASDASYLVLDGNPTKKSFAINTVAQTLATSGTTLVTGSGNGTDHGTVITCSDGNTYLIFCNNDNNPPFLIRLNVATNAVTTFFTYPSSGNAYWTSQPNHFSAISKGAFQDWCCFSSDMLGGPTFHDDDFVGADPVATWDKMQSEIYMVNVLTGALRRLAHTRTRQAVNYDSSARVCASWDGSKVAWASNYGLSSPVGYSDIYAVNS